MSTPDDSPPPTESSEDGSADASSPPEPTEVDHVDASSDDEASAEAADVRAPVEAERIDAGSADADADTERVGAGATDTAVDDGGGTDAPANLPPMPSMLGVSGESRAWLLELPDFEGPLDLLLHLVRRHELDILDIPIAFVTEKYLEYLAFMQALDLEVAGDYLVMAATLAYLKSRELVPTEPSEVADEVQTDDEGPDPREELIARLLEYQKFRAAATDLDSLPISGRDVFGRGAEIQLPPVDPGLAPLTLFRLAEAYHRVLDRARIHKTHEVVMETMSVADRMQQLTTMLETQPKIEFESLFLGRTWSSEAELRSMLVVTLMSLLELTKLGVILVHQDIGADAIVIERKASSAEAEQAIAGYDEQASFGAPKPGVAEASDSGEAAARSEVPSDETPRQSDDAESR